MDEREVLAEAERLFLYDPMHHARVEMAVQVLAADLQAKFGRRMTDEDSSLARHAASVALVVAKLDPIIGEPS